MIFCTPSYYDKFRCIADKCSDNCCIGWEIDIDEDTAQKYSLVEGEFGERLSSSISDGNPTSFILAENERCPFLNENNLCDIILTLGKNALCDICTNHPRYYEWFGDIKEGGIGLSCEEAARIILTEEFSLAEKEIPDEDTFLPDDDAYGFLFSAREKIITYLQDREIPLENALCDIIRYTDKLQECLNGGDYNLPTIKSVGEKFSPDTQKLLEFLLTLEPLDSGWHPYISGMLDGGCNKEIFLPETDGYLRNIAVYFVWRYFLKSVYDDEVPAKINLMVSSVAILARMFSEGGDFSPTACAVAAKNFSKEIEYSEENLEMLAKNGYNDFLYCNNCL